MLDTITKQTYGTLSNFPNLESKLFGKLSTFKIMQENIGERIKAKRKELGISVPKLEEMLGIPKDRIYKWESGSKPSDIEDYNKILAFLESVPHGTEGEPKSAKEKSIRKPKTEIKPYLVPFIPIPAQAGYVKAMDQAMFLDTLEHYALPPMVDPVGAIWRYWEVEGDSMEPTFRSGDIVLTSFVHHMDWENLRNFYTYVIVTTGAVLIKRVFCKNALEWVLISDNEDAHKQELLPVESIKEVWVYRKTWSTRAAPPKQFEIKV